MRVSFVDDGYAWYLRKKIKSTVVLYYVRPVMGVHTSVEGALIRVCLPHSNGFCGLFTNVVFLNEGVYWRRVGVSAKQRRR